MPVSKQGAEWMDQAMCRRAADLSYADAVDVFQQHTDAQTIPDRKKANARCDVCPVFEECLTYWAEYPESWMEPSQVSGGLWGPSNGDAGGRRRPIKDGKPDLEAALDLARNLRVVEMLGEVG